MPFDLDLDLNVCSCVSVCAEYNEWAAYGQSKLANALFSHELARRCKSLGIPVTSNCMHPGIVDTEVSFHLKQDTADAASFVSFKETKKQECRRNV